MSTTGSSSSKQKQSDGGAAKKRAPEPTMDDDVLESLIKRLLEQDPVVRHILIRYFF